MSDYVYTAIDVATLFFKTLLNPDYVDELAARTAHSAPGPRVHGLHSSSSGSTAAGAGGGGAGAGYRGTAGGSGPRMGTIGGSASCQRTATHTGTHTRAHSDSDSSRDKR